MGAQVIKIRHGLHGFHGFLTFSSKKLGYFRKKYYFCTRKCKVRGIAQLV